MGIVASVNGEYSQTFEPEELEEMAIDSGVEFVELKSLKPTRKKIRMKGWESVRLLVNTDSLNPGTSVEYYTDKAVFNKTRLGTYVAKVPLSPANMRRLASHSKDGEFVILPKYIKVIQEVKKLVDEMVASGELVFNYDHIAQKQVARNEYSSKQKIENKAQELANSGNKALVDENLNLKTGLSEKDEEIARLNAQLEALKADNGEPKNPEDVEYTQESLEALNNMKVIQISRGFGINPKGKSIPEQIKEILRLQALKPESAQIG